MVKSLRKKRAALENCEAKTNAEPGGKVKVEVPPSQMSQGNTKARACDVAGPEKVQANQGQAQDFMSTVAPPDGS